MDNIISGAVYKSKGGNYRLAYPKQTDFGLCVDCQYIGFHEGKWFKHYSFEEYSLFMFTFLYSFDLTATIKLLRTQ